MRKRYSILRSPGTPDRRAKRHYDPKTAPEFIAKRKAYVAARSGARQKAKNAEWLARSECAAQDEHFRLLVER